MIRSTLSLLLFFCAQFYGFSQNRQQRKADKEFEKMAYAYASDIYEEVIRSGYGSEEIYQRLGDAYYFQSRLDRAAVHYESFLQVQAHPDPEYYFRFALSLRALGKYGAADEQMEKFMAEAYEDIRVRKFQKHRNYLEEIALQSGRYVLDTLGFNSSATDFAPSVLESNLVFASSRNRDLPDAPVDRWSAQPFLDLYIVDSSMISGSKESGFKLRGLVNTALHESTTCFTADGTTMYFTTNNTVMNLPVKDSRGVTRLKIMRAKRDDKDRWGDIEDLSINSKEFSTAHPALSPDGKILFFVSDRPGGFGASDIWKVAIDEQGQFGEPENLGSMINTPSRETFPFMNANDELFFAADGHAGLGGLDVFVSRLDEAYQAVDLYNIGAPVNTPADDFGYMETETNKRGFFASNRPGGKGGDDIYGFLQTSPIIRKCEAGFDGWVIDADGRSMEHAAISLRNENGEVLTTITTNNDGRFSVAYDCDKIHFVRVFKEGFTPQEVYINDKPDFTFTLQKDGIRLVSGVDLSEVLNVRPVYFDFDSYNISGDAEADLQKIVAVMKQYPALRVEVRSYTDSRGEEAYNQLLSERRAGETVRYLIEAGIDPSRLQATGFGESQPVAPCGEDSPCTEEDHARNRRSVFIVID